MGMKTTMKTLKTGDLFKVKASPCTMTKMTDVREFRCISPTRVEIVTPSDVQVNGDIAFRNGSWKDNPVSDVDPEWYTARGFEVA